jgi:predicted nucleic acid-binding protein
MWTPRLSKTCTAGYALRVIDADILSYIIYDKSPAHTYAWRVLERALADEIELCVTHTTVLESYNVLYWFYRVRPLTLLVEKMSLTLDGMNVLETSSNGLKIAAAENIPLGDGYVIATALHHGKPIIVTNDSHILSKAPRYGLIVENPIPKDVRKHLSDWKVR